MRLRIACALGLSWTVLAASGVAQVRAADTAAKAVSETVQESHLRFLADDALGGRGAGTRGERIAALYIATQFRRLRLQPAGDSGTYFQRFPLPTGPLPTGPQGRESESLNVIGCLPGRGTTEFVLLGAHYDSHLGIGPAVAGDSIYNGAADNASGVATMLSVAEALVVSSARPQRSICFAAFGAEERGLLGSKAYVAALRDTANVVGMLNIDGANIWGQTRDIAVLGDDLSTLGADFRRAAAAEGLGVAVHEKEVKARFFYRSDQLSFARAGIPALFFRRGKELVDGGVAAWEKRWEEYYGKGGGYHQPSDEIFGWHSMAGIAQQARVAVRLLLDVANAPGRPEWNKDSEFAKVRNP